MTQTGELVEAYLLSAPQFVHVDAPADEKVPPGQEVIPELPLHVCPPEHELHVCRVELPPPPVYDPAKHVEQLGAFVPL